MSALFGDGDMLGASVPPQVQIGKYATTFDVVLSNGTLSLNRAGRTYAQARIAHDTDIDLTIVGLANRIRRSVETEHENAMFAKGYRDLGIVARTQLDGGRS